MGPCVMRVIADDNSFPLHFPNLLTEMIIMVVHNEKSSYANASTADVMLLEPYALILFLVSRRYLPCLNFCMS